MIYLDNSATTNPKPLSVISSASFALKNFSYNSGRGGYKQSVNTSEQIYAVREKASALLGYDAQNIIFTQNCTTALNMAVKGLVKNGDHILISNLEHNAVSRPVDTLAKRGIITYNIFEYDYDEDVLIHNIISQIKPNTKLIVCTHASNVFGCAFPIKRIAEIAKQKGICFVVDAAQGAGILEMNYADAGVDICCVAGHKGLYGPMATGIMAMRDGLKLDTIIEGGTGSSSLNLEQPDFNPDRFEAGSLNNSGIIGLGAGIDFVSRKGIKNIHKHEIGIVAYIYDCLKKNPNAVLYTPSPTSFKSAPIISFNYKDYSSEKTANLLAARGIATRAGLHCAPLAHKAFGTEKRGTVRISPSVFTTQNDCEIFLNTLKKL